LGKAVRQKGQSQKGTTLIGRAADQQQLFKNGPAGAIVEIVEWSGVHGSGGK
jgi:hypothetical protein